MPRAPRIHYPGAVYHVMARGVDGRDVFIDDTDRRGFLGTLQRIKPETKHSIMAYCLMSNHFHLAIKVGNTPLSRVMHRLLTAYVICFNARHSREGHLFQARYKSFLCLDDAYLVALIRYIHMNPVRAGLATHPSEWPWSSHRNYTGQAEPSIVDTALFFDVAGQDSREYERRQGTADEKFIPWPESGPSMPLFRDEPAEIKSLDALALELFPDDLAALKSGGRQREITKKKFVLAEHAMRNGHSMVSIAAWMGCTTPAVHHLLRRNK